MFTRAAVGELAHQRRRLRIAAHLERFKGEYRLRAEVEHQLLHACLDIIYLTFCPLRYVL
jgi:hypothetical protein